MSRLRTFRGTTAAICIISLVTAVPAPSALAGRDPAVRTCGLQSTNTAACLPPRPASAEPNDSTETSDGNDDHSSVWTAVAIAAVAVGTVLLAKYLTGRNVESMESLDSNGPKTPDIEVLGQYEVQGLVYPGWPLVVEVNTQPATTTFVRITMKGTKKNALPLLVLSEEGGKPTEKQATLAPVELYKTERGILATFILPGDLKSKGPKSGADDGFRSARFAVFSGHVDGRKFVPEPLDVLAFGAGPNAVGSAAVVISRFDPAPAGRRAAYAVTFNEKRQFERMSANLVTREQKDQNLVRTTVQTQDVCIDRSGENLCVNGPPRSPYDVLGEWPQQTGGELDTGQLYHMELRAWSGRSPQGGWIVDQAPQVVTWP